LNSYLKLIDSLNGKIVKLDQELSANKFWGE